LSNASEPPRSASQRSLKSGGGATLAVVFVGLALLSVMVGVWYYQIQSAQISAQKTTELESIRRLKVDQIVQWRTGLLVDGQFFAASPLVTDATRAWTADPGSATAASTMREWMRTIITFRGYASGVLLMPDGVLAMSTGTTDSAVSSATLEAARLALSSGTSQLTDLHIDPATGRPRIDMVVPIGASGGRARALLVLRADPQRYLFPLIQGWPTPSASSETLLVRREGDQIVYLNDLRFRKGTALIMRLPMKDTKLLAVQAVSGAAGVVRGIDYRGVPVLGAVGPVPGTGWFIVAKIDTSEALAPVDTAARNAAIAVALLILAAGLGVGIARRQQMLVAEHRWAAAEVERLAEEARARHELDEARALLAAVADTVPDAMYVKDLQGRYLMFNTGAESTVGKSRDEVLGRDDTLLLPPDEAAVVMAGDAEVILGNATTTYEETVTTADGTVHTYRSTKGPVRDSDGVVFGLFGIARDVTELKVIQDELRAHKDRLEEIVEVRTQELAAANEELTSTNEELTSANEELAAVNEELTAANEATVELNEKLLAANEQLARATQAKSQFLANMSHELRTPLNSIIGFTGVMQQGLTGPLNEEQQRQLGMVRHSGEHLLALINDVLDLSKIEAGRSRVSAQDVTAGDLVDAAMATIQPLVARDDLDMAIDVEDRGLPLHTDVQKVSQILVNLLGNAVKFTREGCVTLKVTSPDRRTVSFEVTDTGVGISADDLAEVFDEFVQAEALGRKPEGTGLGLPISRKLAEMLGGELAGSSTLGEGSTFTLTIPVRYRAQ